MKATLELENLLHAINIIGADQDVSVEGHGEIAVCPPVRLTPKGRRHFRQALTAGVEVYYDDNDRHQMTIVNDTDEQINIMAWTLLSALAGYCSCDGYDRWFTGENAELI